MSVLGGSVSVSIGEVERDENPEPCYDRFAAAFAPVASANTGLLHPLLEKSCLSYCDQN